MDPIKQLVIAIGGIAEMASVYYKTLILQGLPENVATDLTAALVDQIINGSIPGGEKNGDH